MKARVVVSIPQVPGVYSSRQGIFGRLAHRPVGSYDFAEMLCSSSPLGPMMQSSADYKFVEGFVALIEKFGEKVITYKVLSSHRHLWQRETLESIREGQ